MVEVEAVVAIPWEDVEYAGWDDERLYALLISDITGLTTEISNTVER